MSLHAQLSPEAQAKLAAQKRNSTISAIIIALLVCALLGVILWIIALTPLFKNNEETVSYAASSDAEQDITKPEMTNQVETKPSAPSASMAKVIAANTPSPTAVPVPEITVTEPSLDFGDGDDFGDGWGSGSGDGSGGGSGGFGIPASMKKRCSAEDRIQRLVKEGGKEEYEDQVVNALRWLKGTQNADGSWLGTGKPPASMTGLALLCYLGHCETPLSAEFGETVQNAIMFLVSDSQKKEGYMGAKGTRVICYEHPIATYAIAEAYTLCKEFKINIPGLESAVQDAARVIIDNQHKDSGGWDYDYDTTGARGGDTSVVCWHMQALKALKMTKLDISDLDQAVERGLEYLEGAIKPTEDQMGYGTTGGGPNNMTSGGILCFQQWGKGRKKFPRKAVRFVMDNGHWDYKKEMDLYIGYYASQAMINAQGSAWSKFNKDAMTSLAEAQNEDGSWPAPGHCGHGMTENDAHYATCLATLMMEVYYRFLPSS